MLELFQLLHYDFDEMAKPFHHIEKYLRLWTFKSYFVKKKCYQ